MRSILLPARLRRRPLRLQIFNQAIQPKMVVRYAKGEPMETTLAWAQSECEGYMRT